MVNKMNAYEEDDEGQRQDGGIVKMRLHLLNQMLSKKFMSTEKCVSPPYWRLICIESFENLQEKR